MRDSAFSLGFAAFLLAVLATRNAKAEELRLSLADLRCLVGSADKYLARNEDPVVVFLSNCRSSTSDTARPPVLNQLPELSRCSNCGPNTMILRLAQIRCIKQLAVSGMLASTKEDAVNSLWVVDFGSCNATKVPD